MPPIIFVTAFFRCGSDGNKSYMIYWYDVKFENEPLHKINLSIISSLSGKQNLGLLFSLSLPPPKYKLMDLHVGHRVSFTRCWSCCQLFDCMYYCFVGWHFLAGSSIRSAKNFCFFSRRVTLGYTFCRWKIPSESKATRPWS